MQKQGKYCPICYKKIIPPNILLEYHIRYTPPLIIMACKWCNFAEYGLRNNLNLSYNKETVKRIPHVIKFQAKFGIKL